MDEQKVKEIYKELYEQFKKIKAKVELQEGNVSQKLSDELNEMEQLLTKLKEKAAEANIDVSEKNSVGYTKDSSNDWVQLIDCSESDDKIKEALKAHIRSLGEFPSAKQALDMVDIIDHYYDANVSNPSGTRVNEVYEKIFGKSSDKDEAASKEMYQKSAYAGIKKGIKSITTNWIIQPDVHFHIPFVAYYKNQESLPDEVAEMEIPHQFKIDIGTKQWGNAKKLGFLKFGEPTIQASFKFSYFKDAHFIRTSNEEIFGTCIESYSQAFRSTITLEGIGKGFRPKKGSTTIYSKGLVIPLAESINVVLKTDLGTIHWEEILKAKLPKLSLGAVRLQGNLNLLKVFPKIHEILNEKGVHLDRAIVSLVYGFNLSLDPLELGDFVDSKLKKKPKLDDAAKKITQMDADDAKKLKSLQDKAEALEDKAEKLGKLFKDEKPSKGDVKKAAEMFKESVDDLYKHSQELMKKSEAVQEAVEELLEKTAKKITEKIGTKAIAAAAKMAARAIPVVGAVLTFIEVVTLAYDIYTYFSNLEDDSNGLRWEDRFGLWFGGLF